jgi:hypothetical protein
MDVSWDTVYQITVYLKGIVAQDFEVCFLVSFDRSEVCTHT